MCRFKYYLPLLWFLSLIFTTRSSGPVCDWSAPGAVWALTLNPCSAAGGAPDLHQSWKSSQLTLNRVFVACEKHPGPFFLLSCSSLCLHILLHHSPDLPAPPPGPPCSRKCHSRWEEGSLMPSWCRLWFCLHAGKPAAKAQWHWLGQGFPDARSGTSTTQHCDETQRGNSVSSQWHREVTGTGICWTEKILQ